MDACMMRGRRKGIHKRIEREASRGRNEAIRRQSMRAVVVVGQQQEAVL
jgi:hypothetical protein